MRRPSRDRLEYLAYNTIMTSTTVVLGLGIIFATDDQGKARKVVLDQPLDESIREAKIEWRNYCAWKERQVELWMVKHGYEKSYYSFWGQWQRLFGSSSITSGAQKQQEEQQQQQRGGVSGNIHDSRASRRDLYDPSNQR